MVERELSYRSAQNEAFHIEMERDPRVIYVGEEVSGSASIGGDAGAGIFGTTTGLMEVFGAHRVLEAPISEGAWFGACIGAAMTGLRPIGELMFLDFFGVCADQLINNAAKMRYLHAGKVSIPLTVVTNIGAGGGAAAHHSQSFYSLLAHIPGLKVVAPSDAYTAKGLVSAAIRDDDPVIVCDHKRLQNRKGMVPEGEYVHPLGKGRIVRKGRDVTVVGISFMVRVCLEAAEALAQEGIDVEVIDLLSLYPLDEDVILESVGTTGRLVVVDEDTPHCGIAAEIAARVANKGFDSLDAPIQRVTAPHTPVPYSRPLEKAYAPDPKRVVQAIKGSLGISK